MPRSPVPRIVGATPLVIDVRRLPGEQVHLQTNQQAIAPRVRLPVVAQQTNPCRKASEGRHARKHKSMLCTAKFPVYVGSFCACVLRSPRVSDVGQFPSSDKRCCVKRIPTQLPGRETPKYSTSVPCVCLRCRQYINPQIKSNAKNVNNTRFEKDVS